MGAIQYPGAVAPRILLALQFWDGDRERAGELARLITDLEPVKRRDADVLLSARFDTTVDPAVSAYVGRRFNVYTAVGSTRLTGHPAGSFGLWHDTVATIRDRCADGSMPRYTCALVFEADCTPLVRDWIPRLLSSWTRGFADVLAAGHEWHAMKCPWPHINGNMLLSGRSEHLARLAKWRGDPRKAWDIELYPALKAAGCRDHPLIRSLYVKQTPPEFLGRLVQIGAVFLHGDKDGSAAKLVRSHVPAGRPFPTHPNPQNCFRDASDKVPSVFEQLEGKQIEFPGPPARRYNPALMKTPAGWAMVYRRIRLTDWSSELVHADLSEDFGVVRQRDVRGLSTWPQGFEAYWEDPRLIVDGPQVLLAYVRAAYNPARTFHQCLATYDVGQARVHDELATAFGQNDAHAAGAAEKNWAFFHCGGELSFVYQIHPHTVVRFRGMKARTFQHVPGACEWRERYGEPRGGTPPVEVAPGRWMTFFHSHSPHPSRERRYHWGAYEFTADLTPQGVRSRVTRFTQHPIATASERDGFQWPKGACFWEPVVVFPTGAHYDATARRWVVAAGINDSHSAVFFLSDDLIETAFNRKDPPRYAR